MRHAPTCFHFFNSWHFVRSQVYLRNARQAQWYCRAAGDSWQRHQWLCTTSERRAQGVPTQGMSDVWEIISLTTTSIEAGDGYWISQNKSWYNVDIFLSSFFLSVTLLLSTIVINRCLCHCTKQSHWVRTTLSSPIVSSSFLRRTTLSPVPYYAVSICKKDKE